MPAPVGPMDGWGGIQVVLPSYMGVSLNGGTVVPHFTPQVLIIFRRKTPMVVGETHHVRKPPYIGITYIGNVRNI